MDVQQCVRVDLGWSLRNHCSLQGSTWSTCVTFWEYGLPTWPRRSMKWVQQTYTYSTYLSCLLPVWNSLFAWQSASHYNHNILKTFVSYLSSKSIDLFWVAWVEWTTSACLAREMGSVCMSDWGCAHVFLQECIFDKQKGTVTMMNCRFLQKYTIGYRKRSKYICMHYTYRHMYTCLCFIKKYSGSTCLSRDGGGFKMV